MGKFKARALLASILLSLPLPALAESHYPSSPINLIVSLAAGNTVDVLARLYANKLSKLLGQSVVVINRPGAGGLIAAQTVATATPDGYTILMANSGHAILGQMNKNLPFDPIKDFAGISMVADAPALIVVSPTLHVKTLKEFVELAASKPGTINFGSAGIGTSTHLSGAYFAYKAGVNLMHVPYKNGAEILPDMISGRMQATFSPLAFVLPMLNDHKLEALAVASPDDMTSPISVPSARSAGVDYVYSTWYGMLAPAKMPAADRKILADAVQAASADPELMEKVAAQGVTTHIVQLEAFDTYIRDEMARLDPVLKTLDTAMKK
jgi:tripartite-type tricarboxylate transporter receptor subunit TctC